MNRALGADFKARLLTALVGGSLILLSVAVGPPWFDLAVIGLAALAGLELQHMLRPGSPRGLLLVTLVIAAAILSVRLGYPPLVAGAVALGLLAGLAEASISGGGRSAFVRHTLYLIIGALYIGLSFGLATRLRASPDGLQWLVLLLVNNWSTDSFALIGGRVAGRRKLAPAISPSKTVEGAGIGMLAGFTGGMIVAVVGGLPLGLALVANLVIPPAVVIGDLFESWTKRQFAVKDSGHILPGHGGFLDRMDGTLLALPALTLVLVAAGVL